MTYTSLTGMLNRAQPINPYPVRGQLADG